MEPRPLLNHICTKKGKNFTALLHLQLLHISTLLGHHHLESSSSLFKEEHVAPVAGSSAFTCQSLSVLGHYSILPAPRSDFLVVLTWMQDDEDVAMFGSVWNNSEG